MSRVFRAHPDLERALLDGFECTFWAGSGYQLSSDGDFVLNDNGRRLRCG